MMQESSLMTLVFAILPMDGNIKCLINMVYTFLEINQICGTVSAVKKLEMKAILILQDDMYVYITDKLNNFKIRPKEQANIST